MILEIAPGVETRWVKAAIGRVVDPGRRCRRTKTVSDATSTTKVTETVEHARRRQDSTTKQS